jgi:hypothetical protein
VLPIVLETYLPKSFLWDKDTQNFWLDSLMFCLSGNIASGVRQSYPAAYMQYLRIYQVRRHCVLL